MYFCSRFYLEEPLCFWGLGPNCHHFCEFGGNNSSKRHHIELKFWPQVVLIVVQIAFKAFWNTRIFTETGDVHKVSVFGTTLTPIYPLKMTQIKNSHLAIQINQNQSPISFKLLMKTIITFCYIWAFFRYKWVIRIKLSDHLLDFAPSFEYHTQSMKNRYYTSRPFVWLWTYF